jgi:hypothetical protein
MPTPVGSARLRHRIAVLGSVVAFASLLFGLGFVSSARAQNNPGSEATQTSGVELEVKAAYLYKFANYVEWPEGTFRDPDQPIVIGVLGADELAAELKRLVQGKRVNGRRFIVRRLRASDDPHDLHILFLGDLDGDTVTRMLAATAGQRMLTVSDSRRVFAAGSMVNLVVVEQRVRFEVAMPPLQRSHLRLSALMFAAAYRVAMPFSTCSPFAISRQQTYPPRRICLGG